MALFTFFSLPLSFPPSLCTSNDVMPCPCLSLPLLRLLSPAISTIGHAQGGGKERKQKKLLYSPSTQTITHTNKRKYPEKCGRVSTRLVVSPKEKTLIHLLLSHLAAPLPQSLYFPIIYFWRLFFPKIESQSNASPPPPPPPPPSFRSTRTGWT